MISIRQLFKGLYKVCACGCGQLMTILDKYGRMRNYLWGHNTSKGFDSQFWKFGRTYDINRGYWFINNYDSHNKRRKSKQIAEHIYFFEQYHKCCMLRWGEVHHIDPVRKDYCNNMIWNLMGVMNIQHAKIHHPKTDTTNRRCKNPDCPDPTDNHYDKHGWPQWYGNDEEGWTCKRCYIKVYLREYYKKKKEMIIRSHAT